jgi:hypothetical protein
MKTTRLRHSSASDADQIITRQSATARVGLR